MSIEFAWDTRKESANWRKHADHFSEAVTVFADPRARIFDDPDHSRDEHREIIVGHSSKSRLLLVVFAGRDGDTIRIISPRKATSAETRDYHENCS